MQEAKKGGSLFCYGSGAELFDVYNGAKSARSLNPMDVNKRTRRDGWMDGWVEEGGGLRLAEGEFLVGTHTSSNMLPRQLIKSGTPS